MQLLVLPRPRCPLLLVRPCFLWDVGRAQRCRLLVAPCLGSGSDPAPPSTRGLTLPLGSGSGLVSSSVPWDEFVQELWECVQPENEEGGCLEVIEKVP